MSKRRLTPGYIIFYILFLPDSWQVLIGIVAAVFLTPMVAGPQVADGKRIMLFIMLATIGYAVSRKPARWITEFFKKLILGNNGNRQG